MLFTFRFPLSAFYFLLPRPESPTKTPMETPPALAAPPTSKWPTVIGAIAIVFAAGGLLQSLLAPLGPFMVRSQMQEFAKQGADQGRIDEYLRQFGTFAYTNSAVLGAVAVLLLVGGILLIKRRRVSPLLLQVWAMLKIVAGGFFIFKQMAISRLQMEIIFDAVPGGGGQEAQAVGQITSYAMWIGLGFGLLWIAAFPVFLIVWFNRQRIKDQVGAW